MQYSDCIGFSFLAFGHRIIPRVILFVFTESMSICQLMLKDMCSCNLSLDHASKLYFTEKVLIVDIKA